jgi:hypothetical protein
MKIYSLIILAMILVSSCSSERSPSGKVDSQVSEKQTESDMYSGEASVREQSP